MSTDNDIWDKCSMIVPNCKEGDIPIDKLCYPTSSNSDCTTFYHVNPTKDDSPDKITGRIISENQGVDIQECLDSAMYVDGVDKVIYNSGSRDDIPEGEQCQGNTCYILGENVPAAQELPTNLCNQYIFQKTEGKQSCMSIKSADDDNKEVDYSIDYSQGYQPPGNEVVRASGDYIGSTCRESIIKTNNIPTNSPSGVDYSPMLTSLGFWCKKNPNKKFCNQFCNNVEYAQYCQINKPWTIIISIGVLLVGLFITLMLYKKHKDTRILAIGLGICSLLFIWFGFATAIFIKNKGTFNGNDPDFPSSPDDELNLESDLKTAPNYLCIKGKGKKVDYDNTSCPAPSCCNVHTLTNLEKCTSDGTSGEYSCFSDSDCPNDPSTGPSKCVSSPSSICNICKCTTGNKPYVKNIKNDGNCGNSCKGAGCSWPSFGWWFPGECLKIPNTCSPGFEPDPTVRPCYTADDCAYCNCIPLSTK